MKLFPQDLRESCHTTIIQIRASYGTGATPETKAALAAQPTPKPHVGRLGKQWIRGLPLTPKQARIALPASSGTTQGTAWLSQTFLTIFSGLTALILVKEGAISPQEAWGATALVTGALVYPSFILWPRAALKSLYSKPLTVQEIDDLFPKAHSDLERGYLALVRDAALQTVPDEALADVRAAITALGEAIDALPLVEPAPVNTATLRTEAAALQREALAETDSMIAESQEHQADALLRRADAADRSAQYARRIAALHSEIAAQIAAVQADLATFSSRHGGASDRISLAHLAEGARRVATIAVSAAAARAELDAAPAAFPLTEETEAWRPVTAASETPDATIQLTVK